MPEHTKTNLIGFRNGVYDVSQMKFNKPKVDDYIICTHDYDFTKKTQEECSNVLDHIQHCFVDTEQMRFYLKHLSLSLSD